MSRYPERIIQDNSDVLMSHNKDLAYHVKYGASILEK